MTATLQETKLINFTIYWIRLQTSKEAKTFLPTEDGKKIVEIQN